MNQALVFIGSAVIMVPLFHRLGFGSVLGYLIAGILVGPFGLGFIHDSHSVLHFAELGVVLLLFMIGLEIRPQRLWAMRKQLIGLGGMQVFLTSMVFFGIGLALGFTPMASAVLGLSLSLSSTAFAIQTLTERNQFNTEFGRSSFSVLLMQDLVAIPALAIVPLLAQKEVSRAPGTLGAIKFLALVVLLVLASRFLIRPVFRIIASTRSREIFTAATLFIVLGVATFMQKIGLSAALGTFLAGVLLADSEYRHELEADLEPFKSLLMGLFFIAVGMGVSLDLIWESPLFIFSLAIGYLFIKTCVIYLAGRMMRLNHENAKLMSLNISQGGEFAFVIFAMALNLNIAPKEILDLLTAVISLSMMLSPLINIANDYFSRTVRREVEKAYDEIKNEAPEVIIAGFGRFGQIFGRILRAQGIPFVAIDHDSEQIELVRKFGNKVYYGDASRLDLLEAAGAVKAKYFVLAIDDLEASLQTAQIVTKNFPHLKIFARARNRGHAFDLLEKGIRHIKRETFDSSASFVKDLLMEMGIDQMSATNIIEKFKTHDEIMLLEQFKVRSDDKMFVSISNQASQQLAQVLSNENSQSFIELKQK